MQAALAAPETEEANLPSVDSAMWTVEYARMAVGRNTIKLTIYYCIVLFKLRCCFDLSTQ